MIFVKAKDFKNRNIYKKKELVIKLQKLLFINMLNDKKYTKKEKSKFLYFFLKKKNNIKTKILFRCIITNRGRGVFRPFNVSRLVLKEMIHAGLIPGYSKSVW